MKQIAPLLLALFLFLPNARAFVGLENLIMPAISTVMNSVQKSAFSLTDFASIFADAKPFIDRNSDKLALDIARGQGEYLDALAELLEVPESVRPAWYLELKTRYAQAVKG